MSQYRSRLSATKVERCACARLCRGGLGLWRIFTNISRGFFRLLFYSFSNSQPPSARCADVLCASFQPLQTSAPETSWLPFIQHPYTVNTTLHVFSSAPNVRQRDQILSARMHSNRCRRERSPGQSLDYLSAP